MDELYVVRNFLLENSTNNDLTISKKDQQNNTLSQINFGSDSADLNGELSFKTIESGSSNLVERMRIHTNGYVGIGTPDPKEKLEINGSIRGDQSGALRISTGSGYVDIGPKSVYYSHFYTDRPRYYFDKEIMVDSGRIGSYDEDLSLLTSGTERIRIRSSNGNVGIGAPSPGAKVEVTGDRTNPIFIVNTQGSSSNSRTLTLRNNGTSIIGFGKYPGQWSSALAIQNNSNTRQLWISPLDSAENARIRAAGTGLDFYVGGSTTDTGNLSLSLSSNGNVGIGTTSTSTWGWTAKLNVDGPINFKAGGHEVMIIDVPGFQYFQYLIDGQLFYTTPIKGGSSERFKTNITELELDSGKIYDMGPISFNWIDKYGGKRDFGLIAEEVEKAFPLLIDYDIEGKVLGVKYELLSVLLLNELKKKNIEIGNIKEEMEEFKLKLAKLESAGS